MRTLDTYVGRPVIEIKKNKIVLEGGIEVRANLPKEKLGIDSKHTFITTIHDLKSVQMVFDILDSNGHPLGDEWRIALTPGDYKIFDVTTNQQWNPHELNTIEVPPHPDERVVDGPTPIEENDDEEKTD